jgi:hypothetical protein
MLHEGLNVKLSGYPRMRSCTTGDSIRRVALLNKPYRKKDLAEKIRQVLDGAAAG